jgi:4-hydroxybenzoate polyprenyltransferase
MNQRIDPTPFERGAPIMSRAFWKNTAGFWKSLFLIRRMEYFPVEITIFTMPLLISVSCVGDMLTPVVLEGYLTFFILFSLGDMINCLADRDLDQTYKGRFARAVDRLGERFLTRLVIAEAVVAILLGAHLAWVAGKPALFGLVLVECVLAIEYSVGPIHFKSRGILQLPCLWLILYFIPMVFAGLLVNDSFTWPVLLLAASYATIEMGIILVNTSEDLPEDLAQGLTTVTVALGLRNTLLVATAMVLVGGTVFAGLWAYLCLTSDPSVWSMVVLVGLLAACCFTFAGLGRLTRGVAAVGSFREAVLLVKAQGALVPAWAMLVGWAGMACGVVFLLGKSV